VVHCILLICCNKFHFLLLRFKVGIVRFEDRCRPFYAVSIALVLEGIDMEGLFKTVDGFGALFKGYFE
jgi:hypothetical protein